MDLPSLATDFTVSVALLFVVPVTVIRSLAERFAKLVEVVIIDDVPETYENLISVAVITDLKDFCPDIVELDCAIVIIYRDLFF